MRCLILIALCIVVASAYTDYSTENRFQRLLNKNRHHQNQYQPEYESPLNELFGSDDVDYQVSDHTDELRRERMYNDRDQQCPRDLDQYEQDEFQTEFDGQQDFEYTPRRRHQEDLEFTPRHHRQQNSRYENEQQYSPYEQQDQEYESMTTTGGNELIKEFEEANAKLASRLYKQCKDEKDDKNTVVSPLSVQLALAALNAGARGNTRRQIGRVIAGRLPTQQRKQIVRTLVRHLRQLGQNEYGPRQQTTKIQHVTGIFVTKTTRAQQQFIQQVKRNVNADLKQCDFQRQPQQCRRMINQFVAQKTQGKLRNIVPQDAITDNTKMILVNSLQLKAPWGRQMRQHQTKEAKFYPLDTKKVKIVEVMETQGSFKYYEDELVKIVGIPTEQKELTLYVIVPKDKDGLTDVEKLHLQDGVQLKQLLDVADQRVRHVGIQLPKFQIKHKIDVRRTLRKQGVTDLFDSQRADFSGITGVNSQYDEMDQQQGEIDEQMFTYRRNPFLNQQQRETKLHLNKFIHQTTVKITDQGITATTNTDSQTEYEQESMYGRRHHNTGRFGQMESEELMESSFDEISGFNMRQPQGQKMVKANRAFAFVLKHNPTNQMIMVGRVIDAAQKKVNNVQQTINGVDQL